MRRRPESAPRRYLFAAAALAIPLSQVGHTLAYLLRYGRAGLILETEGVHAYYPAVLRTSVMALGLTLLAALLTIGCGRIVVGRGLGLTLRRRRIVDILVVAAMLQLDIYLAQESLEALAGQETYTFSLLLTIIGWGMVGQLPVALVAALALSWLAAGLEASFQGLRSAWQAAQLLPAPAPANGVVTLAPVGPAPLRPLAVGRGGVAKRGPPPHRPETLPRAVATGV